MSNKAVANRKSVSIEDDGFKHPDVGKDDVSPAAEVAPVPHDLIKPRPMPEIPRSAEAEKLHECGLPFHMVNEKQSKNRIVAYVNQYGYTQPDRRALEFSEKERGFYEKYRKAAIKKGCLAAPKDYFVCALRMYKSGEFPLVKKSNTNLAALAIVE